MRMRIGAGGLTLLLGFGLLPLWLAMIYVLVGSIGSGSAYFAAAGWYVVFALPACLITVMIAGITIATHAVVHEAHRRNAAVGVFLVLCAVAGVGADRLWMRYEAQQRELQDEFGVARALVRKSDAVHQAVGASFNVDHGSKFVGGPGARPLWYAFKVSGSQTRYVVVSVSRAAGKPVLAVTCVAHREPSATDLAKRFCP
jgi:hypothetical protein